MNEFIQMDIFFFISSLASIAFLLFSIVIGIYVFLCVKKVNSILKEIEALIAYVTMQSKESVDEIKNKIESILNNAGWVERIVVSALGIILTKTMQKHGKIKRDARNK